MPPRSCCRPFFVGIPAAKHGREPPAEFPGGRSNQGGRHRARNKKKLYEFYNTTNFWIFSWRSPKGTPDPRDGTVHPSIGGDLARVHPPGPNLRSSAHHSRQRRTPSPSRFDVARTTRGPTTSAQGPVVWWFGALNRRVDVRDPCLWAQNDHRSDRWARYLMTSGDLDRPESSSPWPAGLTKPKGGDGSLGPAVLPTDLRAPVGEPPRKYIEQHCIL